MSDCASTCAKPLPSVFKRRPERCANSNVSTKVSFLEIAADKALADDYAEDMTEMMEMEMGDQQMNSRNE
jgi:hypothetical protein